MLLMVAAMATEMERDLIRERALDGLRAAQAQGRRGGRPAVVNDDVLAVARARQSRGESVTAIACHLKIARSTLYRALQPRAPSRPGPRGVSGAPPTGCAPAGSSWHWPSGAAIPPIEVCRAVGLHFVSDGHHRVSIAAATGQQTIDAYMTEILSTMPPNGTTRPLAA